MTIMPPIAQAYPPCSSREIVRFDAQLPDVSYGSEVTARYDTKGLSSIEVIDRDGGDVGTDYRFADGEPVTAERTIMGYDETGREVVRQETTINLQEIRKSARFFQEAATALRGKTRVGEPHSAVMGDVACYLTFTNPAGERLTEREFSIFAKRDGDRQRGDLRLSVVRGGEGVKDP